MITPALIRVLHIDDDESFLSVSKQILADKGSFSIETALSVDDALTKLAHQNFDVVISDYYLPSKTGLELLKAIREKGSRIPFIMFTGKGREEIIVQALNLGADRFIDKLGEPEIVYTELSIAIKQVNDQAHAERMLWESEERFKKMVTNSNDLIMLTQTDGIILYISPACKKVLGYDPEELEGKNPWVIHPEDSERVKRIFQLALTTEASGTAEYRIITKQGETRWVHHSFSQILENGRIKQVVSIVRDITETKNSQTRLAESEERFRIAVKNSPIIVATMNNNLEVTWIYNAMRAIPKSPYSKLNFNESDLIGKRVGDIYDIENYEDLLQTLFGLIRNGGSLRREITINVEGTSFVLDSYFEPSRNMQGEITGIKFAAYDITENKKISDRLRGLEERWSFALEGSGEGVWDWNIQTNELFLSNQLCKLLGYQEDEIANTFSEWEKLVHPDDRTKVVTEIQKHLNQETPIYTCEHRALCKDGSYKWILTKGKIVSWTQDGKPLRLIGTNTDITARKQAETQLLESEEKFSAAFYSSGAAISISTLSDGLFIDVNDSFLKIFGYTREEVIGKTVSQLNFYSNINERQEIVNIIQKYQQILNREIIFRRKDAQEVFVLLSTKAVNIKGRDHLLTTFIDITDLKKTEKALIQSQKQIEDAISMAPVAVIVFDTNGLVVTCNELATKLLKSEREQLIGKQAADFIAKEDREIINNDLKVASKDHRILNKEYTIKRPNGDTLRVEGSIRTIYDELGKPTAFISSARDITEKAEREKKVITLLEESKRRESDLKELLLVSESVLRNTDFETVLERILVSFKKIVPSESGIILLTTQKSGEITLFQSKDDKFIRQKGIPEPLLQVCREVCPSSQAVYINNLEQSKFANLTKQMPHLTPCNTAIIPLNAKQDVIGYIVLANKQDGFNGNDLLIATLLAEFAEIALENNSAMEAIANREKQLRAITDSAKDAIIVIDSEGKITFWSSAAVSMFGYDSNDVYEKDFHKLFAPNHYLEAYEKGFAVFRQTGLGAVIGKTVELTAQRANKQEFPIELSLSGLKLNELWCAVGIIRDISERKKEREERDRALAQTKLLLEKLSVVGGFVRHDVRNKLSLIINTLYFTKKYATENQPLLKQLEKIDSATENITHLLDFAQTYEAVGSQDLFWIKVNNIIAEAKKSFSSLSDLHVEITNIEFEVLADIALCEIFHNLFDNSIKYGQNMSKIKIFSEKTQNDDLKIVYEDDGDGIDPKIKQRLFQKGAGKGTGLGLYLIQRICEVYGWQVKETGERAKGARFEITIPQKLYRPTISNK